MRPGALRSVAILAVNSWQENLRSRFYAVSAVFGVLILYISLLLGLLASDQELRVLLDFGLAFIEVMGLAGAVYSAATAILRELETKTIYLVLTRPVGRGAYLMGRFLGLMLSTLAAMGLMALAHVSLLLLKGWTWQWSYALAFLGAFLKVLLTAALATFLALATSSVLTALAITLILWSLGHFLPEIRFMIAWGAPKGASTPLLAVSYVVPDLQVLNLRDRLARTSLSRGELPLWGCLLYAGAYASAWLALSAAWLRRKEF